MKHKRNLIEDNKRGEIYIYKNISIKIPPMTYPHFGRVTDGIVSFYGYSYVVQEFPFPALASGFIASTEASSPMPS